MRDVRVLFVVPMTFSVSQPYYNLVLALVPSLKAALKINVSV
jgi:hypothetical protein